MSKKYLLNPNKTSPLDSFYNDYSEAIRIKGNRYATVFDFLVCANLKLIIRYLRLELSDIAKGTKIPRNTIEESLDLQRRFTSCEVYRIASYLNVAMSELYVDRSEYYLERPEFRF